MFTHTFPLGVGSQIEVFESGQMSRYQVVLVRDTAATPSFGLIDLASFELLSVVKTLQMLWIEWSQKPKFTVIRA